MARAQSIPDPDWMLRGALTPALRAVVERDPAFGALIWPEHLPGFLQLLERHRDPRLLSSPGTSRRAGVLGDEAERFYRLSGKAKERR